MCIVIEEDSPYLYLYCLNFVHSSMVLALHYFDLKSSRWTLAIVILEAEAVAFVILYIRSSSVREYFELMCQSEVTPPIMQQLESEDGLIP